MPTASSLADRIGGASPGKDILLLSGQPLAASATSGRGPTLIEDRSLTRAFGSGEPRAQPED
jgi:hypothetical protein